MRCAAAAAATIGEGEFAAAVLESELPVLVEFVAEWCGPCRLISPVVDWASQVRISPPISSYIGSVSYFQFKFVVVNFLFEDNWLNSQS